MVGVDASSIANAVEAVPSQGTCRHRRLSRADP
jgi:hypothetical protein